MTHLHLRNLELLTRAQRRVEERVASVGNGKGGGDGFATAVRAIQTGQKTKSNSEKNKMKTVLYIYR